MQPFSDLQLAQIRDVCRAHAVRRLMVFGSAAREDFDASRSDVDLLVEFEPAPRRNRFELYFELHERLERILARKVDLVEAGSLKNPYIQRAIERDQRAVYAA